jgi:hypothetical protein
MLCANLPAVRIELKPLYALVSDAWICFGNYLLFILSYIYLVQEET